MSASTSALRHARDIRAVFASGLVAHGRSMVVHTRQRAAGEGARWTVVAGRKVGGAVQRNRAKRRLRAILASSSLPDGFDLVVVARSTALVAPFDEMRMELESLLERARRAGATRQKVAS